MYIYISTCRGSIIINTYTPSIMDNDGNVYPESHLGLMEYPPVCSHGIQFTPG